MTDAQNNTGYFLLSRHHLSDPTLADFTIFSPNDILNTAAQATGTFTTLLGGIAVISLSRQNPDCKIGGCQKSDEVRQRYNTPTVRSKVVN